MMRQESPTYRYPRRHKPSEAGLPFIHSHPSPAPPRPGGAGSQPVALPAKSDVVNTQPTGTMKQSPADPPTPPHTPRASTATPWDGFAGHISTIDDQSGLFSAGRPLPLNVRQSPIFARVMADFKARLAEIQAAKAAAAAAAQDEEHLQQLEDELLAAEEEDDDESLLLDDVSLGGAAAVGGGGRGKPGQHRGWAIIRRHLQDVKMERKQKHAGFNWSFLRQHVSHMSNSEKARQEMYDKYLVRPNSWADGLVNYPSHLFNKEPFRPWLRGGVGRAGSPPRRAWTAAAASPRAASPAQRKSFPGKPPHSVSGGQHVRFSNNYQPTNSKIRPMTSPAKRTNRKQISATLKSNSSLFP